MPETATTKTDSSHKTRRFGSMEEIRIAFFPSLCARCGTPKSEATPDFEDLLKGGRVCRCGARWREDR